MNAMQDKEALERQVLEAGQVLAARVSRELSFVFILGGVCFLSEQGHELQQEVKTLLESSEKKVKKSSRCWVPVEIILRLPSQTADIRVQKEELNKLKADMVMHPLLIWSFLITLKR